MVNSSRTNEDFFRKLGIADFSADKREKLTVMMTEAVLKRIFLATMEQLEEKDRDEYESMINNGASQEQVGEFLKSKIGDYDLMVEKIIEDFKEEILKSA